MPISMRTGASSTYRAWSASLPSTIPAPAAATAATAFCRCDCHGRCSPAAAVAKPRRAMTRRVTHEAPSLVASWPYCAALRNRSTTGPAWKGPHEWVGALIRLTIAGRFGNQLVQYAAVRAQAKRLGVDLEIDTLFCSHGATGDSFSFWLDTLPIKARVISYPASGPYSAHGLLQKSYRKIARPLFWNHYAQPIWETDSRFFAIQPRTVVSGYFQSLFYLLPRDDEVLAELSLWSIATAEIKQCAQLIARQTSVSVHVRRGDAVWR